MTWKETRNVQEDFLKRSFTVVKTTISNNESTVYKRMYKWCEKLTRKWGVGQLEEYENNFTFRFWNKPAAIAFEKKFKKHTDGMEDLFS